MSGNCILHVGFGHSGTTSLQENLLSKRDNLFYCGLPYHHFGGIFSAIKYADELDYKEAEIENLCDQYIWSKRNIGQRVVVSDETLTEQTTVYYTPRHMPHEIVACRLKRLFPDSTVLFTIRNQFDYIQANYFVLKRNYAYLANRAIEPFDEWFEGNRSQLANSFLRNVNYAKAVQAYELVFGRDNIRILPLEEIARGPRGYLDLLSAALSLQISPADVDRFAMVKNQRMTTVECIKTDLWPDSRFREFYESLVSSLGEEAIELAITSGTRASIPLSQQQRECIANVCRAGNDWLERNYDLKLTSLGYPCA